MNVQSEPYGQKTKTIQLPGAVPTAQDRALDGRTAVYRFYDAAGQLLYVGITNDLMTRWRWHEKHSGWWCQQARIEVIWHPTRQEAEDEETKAVRSEKPRANIQKRGKTPLRSIRMTEDLWDEFGQAAAFMGTTRTAIIVQFMRWAVGRPGASLPQRPPADWHDPASD